MFADITIDWESVISTWKPVLIAILGVLAATSFGGPALVKVWKLLQIKMQGTAVSSVVSNSDQPSSDQLPPVGFVEYLKIIQDSAPGGNEVIWWGYAKKGMTAAKISLAEASLVRRPVLVVPKDEVQEVKE